METIYTWIGIVICLTQSAMFSGLNLAFFALGRLRLEAEAEKGNKQAVAILQLRNDSNLLLCTILWGNVSVNVLLALLSENALAGIGGFIFSTVGITFFGEIIPQAYFSRNALTVGAKLIPAIKFYQLILFPIAKPCAMFLDWWIGPEGPSFFRERDIEIILRKHIEDDETEISENEGKGALNFLSLDDKKIAIEGSLVRPETILEFPSDDDGEPVYPDLDSDAGVALLQSLESKPSMYRIIINKDGAPYSVLDTTQFLARYALNGEDSNLNRFSYPPILTYNPQATLDTVLDQFVVEADDYKDNVIDQDVILYWTDTEKRILTGADIFGYLLRGIAKREPMDPEDRAEA